jgi:hypothetical protein
LDKVYLSFRVAFAAVTLGRYVRRRLGRLVCSLVGDREIRFQIYDIFRKRLKICACSQHYLMIISRGGHKEVSIFGPALGKSNCNVEYFTLNELTLRCFIGRNTKEGGKVVSRNGLIRTSN